uniref:Flavoprotein domain-containing protein n=1 Tax=Ascaris lumbricoides TaxID=6252 RepID=A0A0M3IM90_ASCLU
MCGERGYGAMATVQMIASIVASDVNNRFAVYSDSNATKGEKRRIVYRAGVTQALTFDEYAAILSNTKKQILERAETNRNLICTNCPLYRPEGGTIIVYDCALYPRRGLSDEQVRKTFRVDGYRWGCSKGVHRLKNGLQKRYTCLYEKDNAHGDKSFMRCEYSLEPCGLVLFHYLGDHEKAALVANTAPHGNAKKSKVPFTRTLPIVLHGIKEKAMQQMYASSPRQIYKNVQQSNDVRNSHVVPKLLRNSEQVRNVLKMIRREKRSSSESRAVLSLAPTTSVTLYDLDNSHPGRGMKWTGSEGEECEAEASFVDELCDVADAKRVKVEREEEYDSDGSADTIDVINVEVDRKMERQESFTQRPSFLHESGKYHILIGVTGCTATSSLHELITQLRAHCPAHSIEIRIVVTENAVRFIDENVFDQIIYQDEDEWDLWKKQGDPLLHLELCNWADTMLIAPLSANSMAKLANGFCDNLLTSVVRAWDSNKPLYYAPAISSAAWKSPLTQQQRKTLQEILGFKEIAMMGKEQDVSPLSAGLMASVDFIASTIADGEELFQEIAMMGKEQDVSPLSAGLMASVDFIASTIADGMHAHLDNSADATTSRIPC